MDAFKGAVEVEFEGCADLDDYVEIELGFEEVETPASVYHFFLIEVEFGDGC